MGVILQHTQGYDGGLGRQQRHGGTSRFPLVQTGMPPHALVRQHSIQAAKLAHGNLRAAEHEAEAVMVRAEREIHPGAQQKAIKTRAQL